ncbi:hypothetical protein JTE90_013481 [Oedothorax gibbosus]|uniref:Uncharacterized protein n=1 Tax=Oedothorax gibbosus TaxID=931172 RepID=A0AAV6VL08_9ARAC|nr:hypothetical protein JTE90_013481 [Oedothorax gibbosus]
MLDFNSRQADKEIEKESLIGVSSYRIKDRLPEKARLISRIQSKTASCVVPVFEEAEKKKRPLVVPKKSGREYS